MEEKVEKGISVIMCCYNSVSRLSSTMRALARQRLPDRHPCEVVLVDNNSSDGTAEYAVSIWSFYKSEMPLRICCESKPGLVHARRAGIEAARYDYLIFCDDDNSLSPLYLLTALRIFQRNINIAACGGHGIPAVEGQLPPWFHGYAEAYATGAQNVRRSGGDLICLYGAGLAVRKRALDALRVAGFRGLLTGRSGTALSSGEDTELTNALVLAGFDLHYSEELKFSHYLPQSRLTLGYLEKLFTAFGTDGPVRDLYLAYLEPGTWRIVQKFWLLHLLTAIMRTLKYLIAPPKEGGRHIYFLWSKAYLKSLWRWRKNFKSHKAGIERLLSGAKGPRQLSVFSALIPDNHFQL